MPYQGGRPIAEPADATVPLARLGAEPEGWIGDHGRPQTGNQVPRLAPGVESLGEYQGSGLDE
jgi:hypothetical protein